MKVGSGEGKCKKRNPTGTLGDPNFITVKMQRTRSFVIPGGGGGDRSLCGGRLYDHSRLASKEKGRRLVEGRDQDDPRSFRRNGTSGGVG